MVIIDETVAGKKLSILRSQKKDRFEFHLKISKSLLITDLFQKVQSVLVPSD